jgi:hypothetical protein
MVILLFDQKSTAGFGARLSARKHRKSAMT